MHAQPAKGARIRQGGPGEDQALAKHLLGMQPRPLQLAEAAQLAELLVLLGHEGDARILQQVRGVKVSGRQAVDAFWPAAVRACCQ